MDHPISAASPGKTARWDTVDGSTGGRRWQLFGLIVAVPLVGFLVSEGLQSYFNSELRSVLREAYPDAEEIAIQAITVDVLCEEPAADLRDLCTTHGNLNLMSTAALLAGLIGLALLVFIKFAGFLARSSRRLLLIAFKPGLYLTSIVLIGLVLVHASIAMGALGYGGLLLGRLPTGLILVIGLGALAGVFALIRNTFRVVKKAQTFVIGSPVSRAQAPKLYERINSVSERLGALPPEKVVVGLDPNFFVTEANVVCLGGTLDGRTLYCSLPLSRIMSVEEFDAVIGHELGHFKGLDTKFSEKFYPIYRGTASSLKSLQQQEGGASIAVLPAIAVLTYFYEAFATAENTHGRDREFSADREGANATSSQTMASALVKVHAFSPFWSAFQDAAVAALQEGKAYVNASETYAGVVRASAVPEVLEEIADTNLSHPTDSHPPLAARLESLNVSLASVAGVSLEVQPEIPAHSLITDAESMEEEISSAYQAILARYLPDNVPVQPERERERSALV